MNRGTDNYSMYKHIKKTPITTVRIIHRLFPITAAGTPRALELVYIVYTVTISVWNSRLAEILTKPLGRGCDQVAGYIDC